MRLRGAPTCATLRTSLRTGAHVSLSSCVATPGVCVPVGCSDPKTVLATWPATVEEENKLLMAHSTARKRDNNQVKQDIISATLKAGTLGPGTTRSRRDCGSGMHACAVGCGTGVQVCGVAVCALVACKACTVNLPLPRCAWVVHVRAAGTCSMSFFRPEMTSLSLANGPTLSADYAVEVRQPYPAHPHLTCAFTGRGLPSRCMRAITSAHRVFVLTARCWSCHRS